MSMKVAVTGASGFIGRYVLTELKQYEVDIVAVTRNASHLGDRVSDCQVVEMDISDPKENSYELLGKPDVLIHLAWDGLPNYKSLHHFETELPKQFCFLKKMINAGLPSLFVTGTCFEYGMQSGLLKADILTNPDNPYGHAKDALRKQLKFLKAHKNFNLTWARLFYMYGEGQPSLSIYPQLKQAVLNGEKVFNMSGGEQLRDFMPVHQVATQIVQLALSGSTGGETLNICKGSPISVRSLVEKWIVDNGWNIKLNLGHYPYPDYEPMAFWGEK